MSTFAIATKTTRRRHGFPVDRFLTISSDLDAERALYELPLWQGRRPGADIVITYTEPMQWGSTNRVADPDELRALLAHPNSRHVAEGNAEGRPGGWTQCSCGVAVETTDHTEHQARMQMLRAVEKGLPIGVDA